MQTPDLTPPPMSKQEVDQLSDNVLKAAGSALRCYTIQKSLDRIEVAMRSALAARDEQWRQRLEAVTQGRHGTVMVDGAIVCCNERDREPCPQQPDRRCASCPGNVTLYRIKKLD